MINTDTLTARLDATAVALSGVCLVHCLLTPVLMTLIPIIGIGLVEEQYFHQVALFVVLPTSIVALWLGCRRHRSGAVATLGISGMLVLVFAVMVGHDLGVEAWVTTAGGVILACSHGLNFYRCRQLHCEENAACHQC